MKIIMCTSKNIVASVLILFIICLIIPRTANSEGKRAKTWDFYIPLSYTDDANFSGQKGSSIDINDDFDFGLGFGYNFTNRFELGGLFNWNSRSYDATVVQDDGSTQQYSNYMETSTISMNGNFYLLEGDITPFVSGSIGYTFIDTNIQNGPPSGVCWWDPWWGYVCTEYVPTKTESDLSYGVGLGVRFDINEKFSMQGSYNKSWIDIDNASETPEFDTWRFDFIFRIF